MIIMIMMNIYYNIVSFSLYLKGLAIFFSIIFIIPSVDCDIENFELNLRD